MTGPLRRNGKIARIRIARHKESLPWISNQAKQRPAYSLPPLRRDCHRVMLLEGLRGVERLVPEMARIFLVEVAGMTLDPVP